MGIRGGRESEGPRSQRRAGSFKLVIYYTLEGNEVNARDLWSQESKAKGGPGASGVKGAQQPWESTVKSEGGRESRDPGKSRGPGSQGGPGASGGAAPDPCCDFNSSVYQLCSVLPYISHKTH